MKITEADVVWVPVRKGHDVSHAGSIRVERHLSGWQRTEGDNWMPADSMATETKGDPIKQLLAMFILFNTVTVRDGIPVQAAHKAFLAIDEYAEAISPDILGARD
jgi:hypothetical protein